LRGETNDQSVCTCAMSVRVCTYKKSGPDISSYL